MDLQVTGDWNWAGDDYSLAYAPTNDPRVVAIIKREDEYGGGHIDGDVYAPAFYIEHGRKDAAGSTFTDSASDAICDRFIEASDYFTNRRYIPRHAGTRLPADTLERYMRIFHGTYVSSIGSSIDQNYRVYVFNTPTWREHVGFTGGIVAVDVEDWTAAADGDVYGVGYGVVENRTTDETSWDELIDEADLTFTCWGMLGEDYAKEECFSYETPELEPLLDFA